MIGPLRATLLIGLVAFVLARRETRNIAGLVLVAITIGAIALLESIDWQWSNALEAIVFGLAGGLAYYGLPQLGGSRPFSEEYEAIDRHVSSDLSQAEQMWRTLQITDDEYATRFIRANARYEGLRPPTGEWTDLVKERIDIRREWGRIFLDPTSASDERRRELGSREAALREKVNAAKSHGH